MSKRYLTVYNLQREKDWILKNAFDIIETKEINTVWSLEFSIPMNDDDMDHCQPYWFVRYGDDGQLYRFTDQTKTNANESSVTYHCEHVIATLCDDVMFQGPFIKGNNGTYTNQVLTYILDKQTPKNGVKNWKLGVCEPRRQFEYSWENENLLAALWSVPTCFDTPYMWTFDTSSYPWTVNLVNIDENEDPDFYLMAKKNILRSTEESSSLDICTRLYGLGEGEGVNQLTIKSINNGLPYIQSAPEIIAKYGIVSRIFVDRRFQSPETLMARMETLLHELEVPTLKREFEIVDLYDISPDDMYKAEVGGIVLLKDDNTKVYITKTVKNWSVPGDMQITIATKATDMSSSIADLADRQRIEQVYSQGASQVYSFSFFGNATGDHPLDGYVYFPDDLKYLNEVKLKVMIKPFRSYSKASSKSSGGIDINTNGGGAINTNTQGGGAIDTNTQGGGAIDTNTQGGGSIDTDTQGGGAIDTDTQGGGAIDTDTQGGGSIDTNTQEGGKIDTSTGEGGGDTGETSIASGGGGISLSGVSVNVNVEVKQTEDAYWDNSSDIMSSKTRVGDNGGLEATETGSSHNHAVIGYTGEVTPPASANYKHDHAMNFRTDQGYYGGEHSHTVYEKSWSDGHSHSIARNKLRHYHPVTASGSGSVSVNNNESGQSGFSHKHNFKIKAHSHPIKVGGHTHPIKVGNHTHPIKVSNHTHPIKVGNHTHPIKVGNHTHPIKVGTHTHPIKVNEHTHPIHVGPHSHEIEPGIFESGNPTQAKILIDGVEKRTITNASSEIDITQDLLQNGKVPRGQWIKISVKPSDAAPNNMAYISVFGNTFAYIQSYTGGNY